jgi:hypothetical protein
LYLVPDFDLIPNLRDHESQAGMNRLFPVPEPFITSNLLSNSVRWIKTDDK